MEKEKITQLQTEEKKQNIVQSYKLTTTQRLNMIPGKKFSLYSQRIMYSMDLVAKNYITGVKLPDKTRLEKTLFQEVEITIPLSIIEKDKGNYKKIKKAVETEIFGSYLKYEDEEQYKFVHLFNEISIKKRGYIVLTVNRTFWELLTDWGKGYRKIDFASLMTLTSSYSQRIFEIISGQDTPLCISIEELTKLLNLNETYKKNTTHLKNRVLDVARDELDYKCQISFDYEFQKSKGSKKYTSILFKPRISFHAEDEAHKEKTYEDFCELLLYVKIFEVQREIDNNEKIIKPLFNRLGFAALSDYINGVRNNPRYLDATNRQGYMIASLKNFYKTIFAEEPPVGVSAKKDPQRKDTDIPFEQPENPKHGETDSFWEEITKA